MNTPQMNYKPNTQGVFAQFCAVLLSLKELLRDAVWKLMKQMKDVGDLRGDHPWTSNVQVYK